MQRLRTGVVAMVCAAGMLCTMTYVSAQRGGAAGARGAGAPQSERIRHLVYIATPGDNGTDNQSGVVVLDADKNYSFLKRISYGLPAALMPGPKNAGIAVSVPLQMLFVTTDGWMKAIDLSTDQIAWTFNGESAPVQKSGPLGSLSRVLRAALVAAGWQDIGRGLQLQRVVVLHRWRHGQGAQQTPGARSARRLIT